ncbi:MAG: D-alanyl-D-alanine carboxypeptidase [Candidatus Levybacteria bacterium]|nr:D-alanyl-D-alanine carboxypeptidase [Candidatus Levybacteria bacterium]
MQKFYLSFVFLLVFLTFSFSSYLLFSGNNSSMIFSPLPSFLTVFTNKQVSGIDLWFPNGEDIREVVFGNEAPDISATSVLIYDLTDDKSLYEKNSKIKLPMASLTKVMTAIVALENPKTDDSYHIADSDLVGENSMGLTSGEVLSLEELLYGLILPSGNDAAEALASNYPGGRSEFINAMNEKTKALGLSNTHFTNPSGLEGDGDQYTTAYDLLVITRYALSKFPLFKEVVSAVEKELPYSSSHKYFYLYNETNLLTSYPGVKGVKTGYTPEAGLCLITYLDYREHEVIGVLLGSQNRRQEMKDLLDYSLTKQGVNPPPHD